MEQIVITFDSQHGFIVKQGDKYADRLCYDEMMGLLSSLTMPKERPCLQWMRTEEEHRTFDKAFVKAFASKINDL